MLSYLIFGKWSVAVSETFVSLGLCQFCSRQVYSSAAFPCLRVGTQGKMLPSCDEIKHHHNSHAKSVVQNKHRLCKFAHMDRKKVAGVDEWSIQISPAKVDIGVKLQTTALNLCSLYNMRSLCHPCHRLDLHNRLLFWMCGFAWAILPAMTSGVMVAEEFSLLWTSPRFLVSAPN